MKMFAVLVRGYGEKSVSSLTIEAPSKAAALQIARTIEFHPTFQVTGNYRATLVEVA